MAGMGREFCFISKRKVSCPEAERPDRALFLFSNDGKALRGGKDKRRDGSDAVNVVGAVRGLILAQFPVDPKTNEIAAIPELLKFLDIIDYI